MPFTTFGLSDPLLRGILATGYTAPTEIQSQVIPAAVEGRDVIGCAQTGTGKTAAFVLPILDRLSHEPASKKRIIKALILTPTRELALQIEKAIQGYGRFVDIHSLAVYGGVNIKGQFNALKRGVDIVVATPGRLMDHMQRGTIDLKHIEVLVLDEADRMLDMGFINDVKRIVRALPGKKRQTMLFSATISKEVKTLAAEMQKSPKMIQIGRPRNPIETITQHIYPVRKEQKMDLLIHMLAESQMYSVLVFSRTKRGADKISRRLKRAGVVSVAIHSGRTQGQRLQAMDGFKRGKFQVMVATDIAARGINIEGISHVINYDVPAYAEDYVHRIGRTGRATALGDAITFVSYDEQKYLRKIENFIGRELKTEKCEGFAYMKSDSLQPQPAGKSKSVRHISPRRTAGRKPRAARRPRRKAAKRRAI
jgi:ATP-dependent RNA helicase RhlE